MIFFHASCAKHFKIKNKINKLNRTRVKRDLRLRYIITTLIIINYLCMYMYEEIKKKKQKTYLKGIEKNIKHICKII